MFAPFGEWWHAGAENATSIYPGRWKFAMAVRIVVVAFCLWIPALPGYSKLFPILALSFAAMTVLMLIAERRRAMIFTESTVVYRPLFGKPHIVAFKNVLGLRRVAASVTGTDTQRGIAIDLPDGHIESWPLRFDGQAEILEGLSAFSGKPVTGKWSWWYR